MNKNKVRIFRFKDSSIEKNRKVRLRSSKNKILTKILIILKYSNNTKQINPILKKILLTLLNFSKKICYKLTRSKNLQKKYSNQKIQQMKLIVQKIYQGNFPSLLQHFSPFKMKRPRTKIKNKK